MKYAIITAIALAMGATLTADLPLREGAKPCAYCAYRGKCYDHGICGAGCGCFKRDPWDTSGVCMSLD